jgi:hypothetical protein
MHVYVVAPRDPARGQSNDFAVLDYWASCLDVLQRQLVSGRDSLPQQDFSIAAARRHSNEIAFLKLSRCGSYIIFAVDYDHTVLQSSTSLAAEARSLSPVLLLS